ncbi:MAG TPA: branched-chain amino acid ABC transporter substrate-binding protein [Bauldia sp.]|nr:branched-chain amino acid ABC transporter substrate-binding protein [Bauldia sp.]
MFFPRLAIGPSIGAALVAAGLAAPGLAGADIVIGVAGPMAGELAPLGAEMRDGAAQAAADINAAGGVLGQQVTVETVDDGCTAKKADAVANQLAGKGALLVVGHLCLQASMAGAAVYAAEHIIEISPGTTFPKFTDERAGPGIFRIAGRDDAEGAFAGTAIATRFPGARIALLDDGTGYGKALTDGAAAALTAAGKDIAMRNAYTPGQKDYASIAGQLAASSIDVVYFGGSDPDVGTIVAGMHDQGMHATVVAGDALHDDDYGRLAGDAAEGTMVSFPADHRKDPSAANVVAGFTARGEDPAGFVLPAYAAVQVWAAAVASARSTDFDKVAAAIQGGTFQTVIGTVSFDARGDITNPAYDWYVWHDGGFAAPGS